jgi:hypothetical protein
LSFKGNKTVVKEELLKNFKLKRNESVWAQGGNKKQEKKTKKTDLFLVQILLAVRLLCFGT